MKNSSMSIKWHARALVAVQVMASVPVFVFWMQVHETDECGGKAYAGFPSGRTMN